MAINPIIISFLIPTKKRPFILCRLIESIRRTAFNINNIELIIYIDENDNSYDQLDIQGIKIDFIRGNLLSMGEMNTACFNKSTGDIIILANDDIVIRTNNWDQKITKVHHMYKDMIYLIKINDLHKSNRFATFPILSRYACSLMQKPFPKNYMRYFIDVHIYDIFLRINKLGFSRIIKIDQIIFEHMHFRSRKANYDNTYFESQKYRFSDSIPFLQLIDFRNAISKNIAKYILINQDYKNQSNILFENELIPIILNTKSSLNIILFDNNLPLKWRFFLFFWFKLRAVYSPIWVKLILKRNPF